MKINEYLNLDLLDKMIEQRYINVQKSDQFPNIVIYNYSKSCQINKVWNDATCKCRGLVVDNDTKEILARPFVKFWNYEELPDKTIIPDLPFEVFEKMDGSLGIMYFVDDVPYITTRGSLNSIQGKHATEVLHDRYSKFFNRLDKSKTYLFEIIWNEEHHCVQYGEYDDIILLAVIDTATGNEENIYNYSDIFTCTKKYDNVKDWHIIRDIFDGSNREGFVVKFANNFRIKMKYEQYFKIHFLKSMLNEKIILEALSTNTIKQLDENISSLDEENQIFYRTVVDKFTAKYNDIYKYCTEQVDKYKDLSDKEAAKYIIQDKYSGVIFFLRRNKQCNNKNISIIWNYIKKEQNIKGET